MEVIMESEIWRVVTEKIGKLEGFKSEREMQAFLMNNPAIVGCWDPDSKDSMPCLIKEEVIIKGKERKTGRIDMMGIAKDEDGNYELRAFELKVGEIDVPAVEQLANYLEIWKKDDATRNQIERWILSLGLKGIDKTNIKNVVESPIGVLVGSKFMPEAIKRALELGIKGIRLARFRGGTKSEHEYYVIIENQIGNIVSGKRKFWSWVELIKTGLISTEDAFSISYGNDRLVGFPDRNYLDYNWIKIIMDESSRKVLLSKEAEIKEKARDNPNAGKWINKDFEALKRGEGLWLSHATALCYFAFGGPTASYWVPTPHWKHEKTGKFLGDLVQELHKKISKARP